MTTTRLALSIGQMSHRIIVGVITPRRILHWLAAIREAVGELETAWAQQLGPRRFAQLRNLLLELNQLA